MTRSTIHRILLRYDLVRDQDRHAPAVKRFEREQPNELWQMDFKGPKNWPHTIGPLSVIDDHSRYLVTLTATGKLDGDLVRTQLEHAFEDCGLPEAMLMDHGTPWWNWQSFSGRTHLSLWIMRQGIKPNPSPWVYPQGAWLLKVDCQGTVDVHGHRWRIGKTLAGEYVMLQPVEKRLLVFFCATLVRELDPSNGGSKRQTRKNNNVKDVPRQSVKDVPRLDNLRHGFSGWPVLTTTQRLRAIELLDDPSTPFPTSPGRRPTRRLWFALALWLGVSRNEHRVSKHEHRQTVKQTQGDLVPLEAIRNFG